MPATRTRRAAALHGAAATAARTTTASRLWTEAETAEYLTTTVRHLRELRTHQRIPFVRVGRLIRYRPAEIEAWLTASTEAQ